MNPSSAAGPDRMPPRILHLIVTSQVSPEAGITGLSCLTRLVRRLARGDIPEQSLPLLAEATLIPLRPRPDKIRPIAIGQVLRRLVTKVLLPTALTDSREFLALTQLANGISSAMDAIVHDARMLMRRHGSDPNYIAVSIDARNAFNSCSRKQMLDSLVERTPSLARSINAMYARTTPHLIIPSDPPKLLQSCEGTQKGDPASMLLFSLTIQPLIRRISQTCQLSLNRWYADDGLLIGKISEVRKALEIIRDEGPDYQFHLNVSKTKAYWPTMESSHIRQLTDELPVSIVTTGGLELLGEPFGAPEFMRNNLNEKLDQCNKALDLIDDIPDARIKFHLHRMCRSACRVQHVFRLVPPDFAHPYAVRFDADQMKAYSRFNNVPLSPDVIQQIRLPLRNGGHGFTPLAPLVHASYAASLIESAPIRVSHPQLPSIERYMRMARPALRIFVLKLPEKYRPEGFALSQTLPNGLGHFEPQALAERPERKHQFLFQAYADAYADASADSFWQEDLWKASPLPRDHSQAKIRRRVRYHCMMDTMAASFLKAHPLASTKVHSSHWSIMIRRHLDVPVYEDSAEGLSCTHCGKTMDCHGDHSTHCKTGFGANNRHHNLRNTVSRTVFKRTGLAYDLEVPSLVPDANLRPADILVQPGPAPPGDPPSRRTAYDVTVRSPYTENAKRLAATRSAGGAAKAERDKKASPEPVPRFTPKRRHRHPGSRLGVLSACVRHIRRPAPRAVQFIEEHARKISLRTHISFAFAKQSIEQNISYSILSSTAEAIISRMPPLVATSSVTNQ